MIQLNSRNTLNHVLYFYFLLCVSIQMIFIYSHQCPFPAGTVLATCDHVTVNILLCYSTLVEVMRQLQQQQK